MARRTSPLYLYDLAIPRDIDPGIGKIKNVTLKNLEDLTDLFEEYNKDIEGRLNLAEYLAEEAIKNIEYFVMIDDYNSSKNKKNLHPMFSRSGIIKKELLKKVK